MSDVFLGAGREPFEDFPEHRQVVEAGGSDGVDLGDQVEFAVKDDPKVPGVYGRDGCGS